MTEYTGRERFWIRCPVCGAKTRLQLLWDGTQGVSVVLPEM